MIEKIIKTIEEVRERSKKRNFSQTFDLIVKLKDLDVKKPENRINEALRLPHGRGKEAGVAVFSDTLKDLGCEIFSSQKVEELGRNAREVKKLMARIDFFLSEPRLMPTIGKALGKLLAPRGLMPTVITENPAAMVEELKQSIRIRVKESPVVQCPVGTEKMENQKIAENIETVLKFLQERLPRKEQNISEIMLKLTMGKPIKIEV
jgi:large subunit ribosomal protein L1